MKGTRKLLPRWLGPFRITKVVNPVAYKLELPTAMQRLHPVFHVGLLKAYYPDAKRATFRPFVPISSDEDGPIMEVERILDHRDVVYTHGGKNRTTRTQIVREYLVHWHGYEHDAATWEPEDNLMGAADTMLAVYRKSIHCC